MALRTENYDLQRYIEKAMVDLPALPTVIVQVLQATDKETVTTNEVEALISADAAITSKMLKVVNSAYFGLPRQVGSIGQAIGILGMYQVRNLVLSVGVLNALSSPSPRVVAIQKEFWEHAFVSATCSQAIAKRLKLSNADQDLAFIGGLLHDIGRLFLFTQFTQAYQQVIAESTRLNEQVNSCEQRILGTTHAELGGVLADKWNLPVVLGDMIRYHEDPDLQEGGQHKALLYCIHVADRLSREVTKVTTDAGFWELSEKAVKCVNFTPEELEEFRAEVKEFAVKAVELLGAI